MRFSEVLAASLVAPLVAAHGDIPGAPKFFGMPKNLRARHPVAGHQNVGHQTSPRLQARQGGDANNMCGPQGGGASCAAGYCCSGAGYCGISKDHCAAPDCQIDFGPGCDANKTPIGATTKNDARPQLGAIPYGGLGIRECLKPKTVAITYDDGPYIYTEQVMAKFAAKGWKATFFVTGNNIGKGAIDENWTGVIKSMYDSGHQIASHTWSHQNLDSITQEQRVDQMVKNEMAIRNIIGKYPTYMRPPYSACESSGCQADMAALGYVVTSFDLDTDDYNQLTKEKIETAKTNFKNGIDLAGADGEALAIAHDIHELTAVDLTDYMLEYVSSKGWTAVTVGECMNDPEKNWYRDSTPGVRPSATPSSSVPVPTPTGPTSTDGQCGSSTEGKGQSCIGFTGPDGISECCSSAGWCGRSSDHCGTGCNPLFGKCGTQPSISASVSVSQTSAAPQPTVSLPTSTDGDCGANAGKTCKGFFLGGVKAECCSEYGYCGNTDVYCGTGCNPYYGDCGSSSSSSSASMSQASSTSHSEVQTPSSTPAQSSSASSTQHESASASYSASVHVSSASVHVSSTPSASHYDSSSMKPTSNPDVQSTKTPDASVSKTPDVHSTKTPIVYSTTVPDVKSSQTPDVYSTKTPDVKSTQTADVYPAKTPSPSSADNVYPTQSSAPVYPSNSAPVYQSTPVKPTSTPCDDDDKHPTPTPTPSVPISKDGKCGSANGGQTCAGYKNPFGNKVECCCKESGRCSTDPWACGAGCDAKFGNCNKY
ncbi:hypothetical protein FB567DRAFT_460408 [Paraphoma chrysanthemicola]|uniref:Carbohydrate esterase family 4 protein n=1 Tax=Paraphoma chrysanthemicola TaxID=798071 RepID=A0A8K0W532_9PLEO|nr:hypothetical protein FB567DRAFT_460408 [Paraphoma chrysanthemicola]